MEEGTGYRLIMGFIIIAVSLIVWLPLNDAVDQAGDIFNAMDTGNATYTAEMIERNDMVLGLFANLPVFLLFVYGIWVIKSAMDKRGGA